MAEFYFTDSKNINSYKTRMKIINSIFTTILCLISSVSFSQRGIDGNKIINAAGTIVNEYTTLTADATSGATTITVAASGLNANSRFGAGNSLAAGDLIMIIQMQGTTILGAPDAFTPTISNPNDATWGSVTNYNNTGKFEFCQVSAVPSSTSITVDCGLTNSYTAAGRVQIIRVQRYNTLTITSPGVLTCQAWNGSTGGVLSVEVYGNTIINAGGKINASSTGFRGGALFTSTGRTTTGLYSCVSLDVGTNKGESVAGFDTDYTPYGGKYCRAAPANGGGGGNVWNCGGGGGGNASPSATWTGQGNPNNSVAGWTTAWNLEAAGFATSTSSGGGRGGYAFSNSNQNATLLGPGTVGSTNAWGGSYRYNLGGLGGRALDYSTGRIFLGGGGGAGEQDNNQGGAGGVGGGIIYITSYGTITGTGNDSIISNGANGGSTNISGTNTGKDAGGGGGAGGTILINSVKTVSGVFIKANGGIGGNQLQGTLGLFEAEGPGGGGGGGYIGLTSGPAAASQQSLAGSNGISQSPHVTEFLPNGATMGGVGLTNQAIIRVDTISGVNATICSGNTATLTASINGTIVATINWYAAANGGSPIATGGTFTTPVLSSTTTYYVGFCPGTYRIPVIVTVNPGPTTANAGINQTVCSTSATLAGNTPVTGTGTWTLVSGAGTITTPSSPSSGVTGLGAGANVFQWSISSAGCPTSTSTVTITNTGGPTTAAAGSNQTVCGTTATLAGNTPTTGTGVWTLVSGAGTITTPTSPTSGITGLGVGANVFQWTISSAPCPPSTSTVTINVSPLLDPTITPVSALCISASSITLVAASTGGTWSGIGITNPSAGTFDPATAGIGTHQIIYTQPGACGGADTINITINTSADATINQPPTLCLGTPSFNLSAAASGGTWTGTGITSAALGTFDPATAGVGTHLITYSISGTCSAVDTMIVTITAPANASITAVTPVCSNATPFNLNAATSGGTWSGTGITNASTGTFDPSVAAAGINTITYSIGGPCGDTATQSITVNPAPTPGFSSNVTGGCAPVCVTFTEAATNNCNSMLYDLGDGTTSSASTSTHCYSSPGTYSITITCSDLNGCVGTNVITNMITVSPTPTASFTSDPSGAIPPNSSVSFTDVSTNGGLLLWDFGDPSSGINNNATTSSPSHTFVAEGTYCVTLIASNTSFCVDSVQECITVANDATFSIPNVFTPNGDGNNDIFFIKTTSTKELSCSIYDRWGLKITEWDTITGGWDGRTNSGNLANSGVYFFVMKAVSLNNKTIEKQGFIQLLRDK